jgi:hypothetical protein
MRKKKNKTTKKAHFESLPLIHPNAAGIDVGSKEHLVAVPLDRDPAGTNLSGLYARPPPVGSLVKALWH